jgi:hypothetical protein
VRFGGQFNSLVFTPGNFNIILHHTPNRQATPRLLSVGLDTSYWNSTGKLFILREIIRINYMQRDN